MGAASGRTGSRPTVLAALTALSLLAGSPPGRAGDDEAKDAGPKLANDPKAPLPERTGQAIDSGVAWLRKKAEARGNWSLAIKGDEPYEKRENAEEYKYPAGCTALSLYTLLKCQVPPTDPVVVNGFKWLKENAGGNLDARRTVWKAKASIPGTTYEIAAVIVAIEARSNPHKTERERERSLRLRIKKGEKLALGVRLPPEDAAWMKELVTALLRRRYTPSTGWRYGLGQPEPRGPSDMSSSQLAMLAILAAERCGVSQPDKFYLEVLDWTLRQQEDAGPKVKRWEPPSPATDSSISRPVDVLDEARGWPYMKFSSVAKDTRSTAGMTACGLANVAICSTVLESRESKQFDGAYAGRAEKAWNDGIAWLQSHWSVAENANAGGYHIYWLYCLERLGDLKRANLVAGHAWYEEGAQVLVDSQDSSGAWLTDNTHEPHDLLATCFSLLFLNRTTPAITAR